MKRRKMSRKQKKKEALGVILPPLIAIVLIVVVAIVALTTGMLDSLKYSSKKADLYSYFGNNGDSEAVVVKYGSITDEKLPIFDGKPYVKLSTVNEEFHDRFYYDTETDSYLYTRGDSTDSAGSSDRTIKYKGSSMTVEYDPYVTEGDTVYMAIDYLKLYKNVEYKLFGGDNEPYRIWYSDYDDSDSIKIKQVKKEQAVRTDADKKSDILKEMSVGDRLIVLEAGEEWTKVETEDLIIGYIENKFLDEGEEEESIPTYGEIEDLGIVSSSTLDSVILTWHNVSGQSGVDDIRNVLASAHGINVISPTWFTLADDEANVVSTGSREYVDICHEAGVQVWGLFDDIQHVEVSSFEVYSKASKREKVIAQLISYAKEYGLDGINIDVETIPAESGVHFAQFIRELSMYCRRDGIVLSVDNYVPMGFNDHYNRAEQGTYADYVIIMGYDEHYSGSDVAGSVASIGYVRSGIENTLADVPAGKIINGVPLYTRLWIETPKTEEEIDSERVTYDEAGNETVTKDEDIVPYNLEIQTLKMAEGTATATANATVAWDEETAQNYATWTKGDKTYEIWLEDRDSLTAKLDAMKEYGIAGVAAWQVNFAESYVWDLFGTYY